MEASQNTAAAAGAWTGFGFASVQAWQDHHESLSTSWQNVLWLLAFLIFIGIPAHLLVFGRGAKPFQRDLLFNAEERLRQVEAFKRMFVWLVFAGFVGIVWSLALMAVVG